MITLFKRFLYTKYKFHAIMGPVFKLFEAIFELLVPFVIKYMINVVDGVGDDPLATYNLSKSNELLIYGGILILFAVVGIGMTLVCQYLASKAAQGVGTDLRNDLYRHINSLSFKELDEIGTSGLINRLTADINNVQQGTAMTIRLLVRAPFIVLGATILSFMISWKIGLIFLITSILLTALIFGIMFYTVPKNRKAQKELDSVTKITKENLSGSRVVRAFSKQKEEYIRFVDKEESLCDIQVKVGKINALLSPVTFLIVNLAIIILLYFAGMSFSDGDITRGDLQALINYFTQIQIAIVALTGLIALLAKSEASARRINDIYKYKSSITYGKLDTIADTNTVIEFKNVSFKYNENANNALTDVSFKINKGETIGIIGSTGSGKSTLINLMNRFYDANSGEVLFYGNNVKDYKENVVVENISTVMQKAVLFTGTVRFNLLNGNKSASLDDINLALEMAQAKSIISKMSDGLDTMIYQGGKNLSGGEKQRLSIARALLKKSDILILDDSSSALDFKTELNLRRAIKNLNKTTIIISQRASSIMHADNILVVDNGMIVGQGKHNDLLKSCAVYQEICDSQDTSEVKE